MISFKSFVEGIHNAIMSASDSLKDNQQGLLDKYFDEKITEVVVAGSESALQRKTLVPKMVHLEYPVLKSDGVVHTKSVQVPLLTLDPISSSQIEKATLTADFEMEIVDGDLQLHFGKDKNSAESTWDTPKAKRAQIEIVISPRETPDGLKLIIEGYETVLKRQIS